MPLDPLATEVAAVALHLAKAGQVALAGGSAMLAHDLVDRPTADIDLFTPEAGEAATVTNALTGALRDHGYTAEVPRRGPTFTHLGCVSKVPWPR